MARSKLCITLVIPLASLFGPDLLLWRASAQGTAFTYQGRLNDGGAPATGIYDLRFTIYDAASGGGTASGPLTNAATSVSNGLFTVALDFGSSPFNSGAPRWIEVAVRTNGSGAFFALAPRQPVNASPYAITAANVTGSAATAGSFSGALSGEVTGTQGATVISTNFPRLDGTNIYDGSNTFLGVLTATNPANAIKGKLSGQFQGTVTASYYDSTNTISVIGAGNPAFNGPYIFSGTNLAAYCPGQPDFIGYFPVSIWTNAAHHDLFVIHDPAAYLDTPWFIGETNDFTQSEAATYDTYPYGGYYADPSDIPAWNAVSGYLTNPVSPPTLVLFGTGSNTVSLTANGAMTVKKIIGDGSGLSNITPTVTVGIGPFIADRQGSGTNVTLYGSGQTYVQLTNNFENGLTNLEADVVLGTNASLNLNVKQSPGVDAYGSIVVDTTHNGSPPSPENVEWQFSTPGHYAFGPGFGSPNIHHIQYGIGVGVTSTRPWAYRQDTVNLGAANPLSISFADTWSVSLWTNGVIYGAFPGILAQSTSTNGDYELDIFNNLGPYDAWNTNTISHAVKIRKGPAWTGVQLLGNTIMTNLSNTNYTSPLWFDDGAGHQSFSGAAVNVNTSLTVNGKVSITGTLSGNAAGLTNIVLTGPTNSTPPMNTSLVRGWINFTNASGGVFKIPFYQ
jgi:hypothetical protein